MNPDKQELKGSDSRDTFKHLHKNELHQHFYALDIDFALIEKNLGAAEDGGDLPLIVAIIDFKLPTDDPTFSEVLAYNQFLEKNIPVYIVEANSVDFVDKSQEEHRFDVYEYKGGEWKPSNPTWEGNVVLENASWDEFGSWQSELRIQHRNIKKAKEQIRHDIEKSKEQIDDLEQYEAVNVMEQIIMENNELVETLMDEMDDLG